MTDVRSLTSCNVLFGNTPLVQEPASRNGARETLTVDLAEMMKSRTGDLAGMIEWVPNFNHRACTWT